MLRLKNYFSMWAVAVLCVAAAGACTVTREQPNLVGQDVRLTILHTSDIHSRLFPYNIVPTTFDQQYGLLPENAPFGGAARMATIAKRERLHAQRSLWLDSGDCFQGAPVFNMFKGEAEMRALSEMGVDGAVIGNHEFDAGSRNLFEQIDNWAEFPLLAANYVFEDPRNPGRRGLSEIVEPYRIYDVQGLKVAVIGMGNWSSMTGIFEGGNSLGIRPRLDAEVVREYVRFLRPAVDLVVVLSHLGLDEDEGLGAHEVYDKNREIPANGVDLILGGHLHIILRPEVIHTDAAGNQTFLTHPGAFAKFMLRHDIVVRVGENNADPENRSHITAIHSEILPVDSTIPEDPVVTEMLHPYSVALNREIDLNGVFAYVNVAGQGKINRSHPGGDSQLGNMVARAMQTRTGVEAEIALTNSLGIRADFEPGPLTVEQTFNTFPFENSITVMYLQGREIQDTLDFVARRSAERGCQTQAQISGMYFDMVCDGACPHDGDACESNEQCGGGRCENNVCVNRACARNIFVGEGCRGGDPNGPSDPSLCTPLVQNGLYKVAVNDYIANGGSGFKVLQRNTTKEFTNVSLRDALVDFLRKQTPCGEQVEDFTDPNKGTVRERFGNIACLDGTVEAHDGRIRPVFE